MNILIIGGGLCGLATALALRQAGHNVRVFERAPELKEIGAGIQLSPNATRLLGKWGILDDVRERAFQPEAGSMRSYKGDIISTPPPGAVIERIYQWPYLVIHRAELLEVLYSAAVRHGVVVHLGCEVKVLDFDKPSLTLSNGNTYDADVIFGADGDRSICRDALLGYNDLPSSTGDVVFRIAVPRKDITSDHPSWELLKRASVNLWLGPDAHAVSYLLRDDILNVVIVCAEKTVPARTIMYGPQQADLGELRDALSTWDPAIQGLLEVGKSDCTMWTLLQINEVPRWSHPHGRFSLIGDAAHAMLPYLAQGAAQAFEDAGVLGAIFRGLTDVERVSDALGVFEEVRKPRVSEIRKRTLIQKRMYGLRPGLEQKERDAKLALGPIKDSPNALADPMFQGWLWSYNAAEAGLGAWQTYLYGAPQG